MTHASLFSGIGGPEVAAAMLGWDNAFHCEINPFGRAVLEYWFPESKSYDDITKTNFKEWRGKIDVLTGGFPCQPFSYAGKRKGHDDDRYLWPEMLRAIDEIRPAWVIGENVAGLATMVEGGLLTDVGSESSLFSEGDDVHRYELDETFTIERICGDLEQLGYSVQPVLVPAAAVGAPHRRDRIFILAADADTNSHGRTPRDKGGRSFGERSNDALQGERRIEAKRIDGLPSLQRNTTDSASRGGGTLPKQVHAGVADGHRAFSDGCILDAPNTEGVIGREGPGPSEQASRESEQRQSRRDNGEVVSSRYAPNPDRPGREESVKPRWRKDKAETGAGMDDRVKRFGRDLLPENRWAIFPTVSPVHRGNDGIPFDVDGLTISPSKWRTESLKAYGNAIVPQVMYQIFKSIELCQVNQ